MLRYIMYFINIFYVVYFDFYGYLLNAVTTHIFNQIYNKGMPIKLCKLSAAELCIKTKMKKSRF